MEKYRYTIHDNTVQVVGHEGTIMVYDIASWQPEKVSYYRSLLAQRRDMDYAKEYLNQMFFEKDTSLIDGALINSAIQLLVKCFSNPSNKGRKRLDSTKVFRTYAKKIGEEDLTKQFSRFYDARNTVISHDQINYNENIVGLAISVESGIAMDIAEITIRTGYLYAQNQEILLRMVNIVSKYIDEQIQELRQQFIDEYNSASEKPVLPIVSCENIPMATAW